MAKGKNYRQAILTAVENLNGWDKEVHLDALAMDTGIEPHKITGSISLMRHEGWPIDIVRREGRKIVSWKFKDQAKWTDKVVAKAQARGEALKKGEPVRGTRLEGHNTVREAANAKALTEEDMERGRHVLMNYNSLPQKVKDQIDALKKVLPQPERGELEQVLVDLLGAKPVQDSDPSFWAVDEFADGSLMLARKDGSHWKATKL